MAIANHNKPFYVVCDASDFAIGCALMQHDDDGHKTRQLLSVQPTEANGRNYPVHGKKLLHMKCALAKFQCYLLGDRSFTVYTGHASVRTSANFPHISQKNDSMVFILWRIQLPG